MSLGDLTDSRNCKRRKDHDRDVMALAVCPKPICRAIVKKGMRATVTKADAEAEHARLAEPSRDSLFARRIVERHFAHHQVSGMAWCGLDASSLT